MKCDIQNSAFRGSRVACKKLTLSILVLVGCAAYSEKTCAQAAPKKAVKIYAQDKYSSNDELVGIICGPNAEFPGGQQALKKYLSKTMRYPKGAIDGKVFASFVIRKDGAINDIKIIRHLNPVNDQEVIRVLRLSPKWTPAKLNNKPVDQQYTIPIRFSRIY